MKAIKATEFEVVADETGALILTLEIMAILQNSTIKHWCRWRFCSVGWCFNGDVKQPILLVTDLGLEEETVTFNSCWFR
jgi:hypothetical protein